MINSKWLLITKWLTIWFLSFFSFWKDLYIACKRRNSIAYGYYQYATQRTTIWTITATIITTNFILTTKKKRNSFITHTYAHIKNITKKKIILFVVKKNTIVVTHECQILLLLLFEKFQMSHLYFPQKNKKKLFTIITHR